MMSDFGAVAPYVAGGGTAFLAAATAHLASRNGVGMAYWRAESPALRANVRRAAKICRQWNGTMFSHGLINKNKSPNTAHRLAGKTEAPQARIEYPKVEQVTADAYGITLWVRAADNVGVDEFRTKAKYLKNRWKMLKVQVEELHDEEWYGCFKLRAVFTDPLTLPVIITTAPLPPESLETYELGLDDYGYSVQLPLAEAALITVAGNPGYGKTKWIQTLIFMLAGSPCVQFIVANGKAPDADIGDFRAFAPRLLAMLGEDTEMVKVLLAQIQNEMRSRYRRMYRERGANDFWKSGGPTVDMPLLFVILDECQSWVRDKEIVETLEDIAKKCRAAGIVLILSTQKPTDNSMPTEIRDVATSAIAFPVRTTTAAVAALGEDIREFKDMNPQKIMRAKYRGVGTIGNPEAPGYVRFKAPYTEDEKLIAAVVRKSAALTRDIPGITVGTEHRGVRVPDTPAGLFAEEPAPKPKPKQSKGARRTPPSYVTRRHKNTGRRSG